MEAIEERPERDGGATAGPSTTDLPSSAVFTKRRNRGNLRKRTAEEDAGDGAGETSACCYLLDFAERFSCKMDVKSA